jgi:peptide/nickel transport system substrate-binding protein
VDHDEAVNQWAVTWFGRGYLGAVLPAALDDWDFTEQEYLTKFIEFKKDKSEAIRESMRLLNAAGFTRENPLKFTQTGLSGSFSQAQAELHQAQFNRLGQGVVQVPELRLFPLAQVNNVLAQGDFEYYGGNVLATQPYDPGSWVATMYATNGGRNYGKMSDPKLDKMLEDQRAIFDVARRKAAIKEMITYMIDNVPYTSWSGRYVINLAYRRVKNWAPEGASAIWGYNYEQVWLDV